MNLTSSPIDAATKPWIPLSPGVSFKPLRFGRQGRSLQLKVDAGVLVPPHRHTGPVHAYNLSGSRALVEKGEIAGPGAYVYEPPGNLDSWRATGDGPCVVLINLIGRVEYIDEAGAVIDFTDTDKLYATYLAWCAAEGVQPALQRDEVYP